MTPTKRDREKVSLLVAVFRGFDSCRLGPKYINVQQRTYPLIITNQTLSGANVDVKPSTDVQDR